MDQAARQQLKEFARKNAANALSVANMLMGMASILSSLNGWVSLTSHNSLRGFLWAGVPQQPLLTLFLCSGAIMPRVGWF